MWNRLFVLIIILINYRNFDYLGSHFAIIIAFMPILLLFIASTKKYT